MLLKSIESSRCKAQNKKMLVDILRLFGLVNAKPMSRKKPNSPEGVGDEDNPLTTSPQPTTIL